MSARAKAFSVPPFTLEIADADIAAETTDAVRDHAAAATSVWLVLFG
jgi:hypothetical protein